MKIARFPLILLVSALAGGCAAPYSTMPMQSSGSEVRASLGAPTDMRTDVNGDALWDYTTGPAGTETWRFRIAPDGKVKERLQLLTPERFSLITVGQTTKADLQNIFGRPARQVVLRSGEVWEWRMQQSPEFGHYAVRFGPGGVVAERMVLMDQRDDDDDRSDR